MDLQKIEVKFLAVEREPVPHAAFIEIFHGWVQSSDGVLHDVADYSHMHHGPGVILIARDFHVSVDETAGRRGFLFRQRARLEGSNHERVARVFQNSLDLCRRLQAEPAVHGKIEFRVDDFELTLNDRLIAPNVEDSYRTLEAEVPPLLKRFFAAAPFSLQREMDPRKRVRLHIRAASPVDQAALFGHAGGPANGWAASN